MCPSVCTAFQLLATRKGNPALTWGWGRDDANDYRFRGEVVEAVVVIPLTYEVEYNDFEEVSSSRKTDASVGSINIFTTNHISHQKVLIYWILFRKRQAFWNRIKLRILPKSYTYPWRHYRLSSSRYTRVALYVLSIKSCFIRSYPWLATIPS